MTADEVGGGCAEIGRDLGFDALTVAVVSEVCTGKDMYRGCKGCGLISLKVLAHPNQNKRYDYLPEVIYKIRPKIIP